MPRKGLEDILQLGDPLLYETCQPVLREELPLVPEWVADLANAMAEIRRTYNFGRGIAAPQLGIMKRLIYIDLGQPRIIINPEMDGLSEEMFELWDDCMSFPNLLVRVKRHRHLTLRYRDQDWVPREWQAADDVAELIQHEVDHLDGILCTMRALNPKSFRWRG
ncbi:MAG TPA: peptide deformylase [Calditrichia bacterium]|nr:peptide deformylase [Calditrichota bacterium]HQU71023.1 peptide deformylase [Calditrichia bacterium]HQV31207.1 peptide deformylase [Calditrichia bacterium]